MKLDMNFQNNIELWSKSDPKQAVRLQYLDCSGLTYTKTAKGELNLKGKEGFYHSQKDASQEAQDWFASLQLEGVPVIYVYGIGLGHYYEAVKKWLHAAPERRLIFLEDDLAVLHRFFETDLATILLTDPQVQILHFEDLKDQEAVFEILYWNFAMKRLIVTGLKLYEKRERFAELRHQIAYDAAVKNALVDEYLRFGGAFFINFYQNMLALPGSYLGTKTFGSFRTVPAIICGAGPSLEAQLPLLAKQLDKALIFAGGSAMNVLNAAHIQPHLGAGIDPNPAQYERLSQNTAFEVPYYYRNRLYHEAFQLIHGPRLFIPGCGGYDVGDFFEERFKIAHEFLDEGHNVINFCLQIAYQLGCNPIIFVGMDLAYTGMKTYSPGVEKETRFDPEALLEIDDFDSRPILQKDIYGKPLYTLWKWVAEADWIGQFAKDHPDVTLYNCTEGGIGFPDVRNEPFSAIVKRHLKRSYPIHDRLQGEIQNSGMPQVTHKKMRVLFLELRESLKRSDEALKVLLDDAKEQQRKLEAGQPALQGGLAALAEVELAEERGYQDLLEIFNQVQARLLNHELHEIQGDEKSRALKKLAINSRRLLFLRQVAGVNIGLIEMALEKELKIKPKRGKQPVLEERSLDQFDPIRLPNKPSEGQQVAPDYIVRSLRQYGQKPEECRIEKNGVLEGECCLYYPDGTLKARMFYKKGLLHGPSTFYSKKGTLLAETQFIKGKREGESRWYYDSGKLYAIQRFKNGLWHGEQLYFYPTGGLKTRLEYDQGVLKLKELFQ